MSCLSSAACPFGHVHPTKPCQGSLQISTFVTYFHFPFWANQGHQPASASGRPTAGGSHLPPKAPLRVTTPVTQTYTNQRRLQEGAVLREFQCVWLLLAVHGQCQVEPPRTADGARARLGTKVEPSPSHLLRMGVGTETPQSRVPQPRTQCTAECGPFSFSG